MGVGHSRQLDVVRAIQKDLNCTKPDLEREGTFRFLDLGDEIADGDGIILQKIRRTGRDEPEIRVIRTSGLQPKKEELQLETVCSKLGLSERDAGVLSSIYHVPTETYLGNSAICLDAFFHLLDQTTRQYLGHALKRDWACLPPEVAYDYLDIVPHSSGGLKVGEIIRKCIGYALRCQKFDMASALTLLLDQPSERRRDKELIVDVVELLQLLCPHQKLPPQLVLRRSEVMSLRGDLQGSITDLTSLLREDAQGCWKDAVAPLVESITAFATPQEDDKDGIIASLELISRCLCRITRGDYEDLKEMLGFQYGDRYYQAHMACKEAAALARCSLLSAKTQNLSAEALLMYTASHHDSPDHLNLIEQIITVITSSLSVHKSKWHLECRREFFEFIKAIYLLRLSFVFSERDEDKRYATKLEETAMFLYGKYCQQLVAAGFLTYTLSLTPDIMATANSLMVDLGLGIIDPTASCCIEISRRDLERKSTSRRHMLTFGNCKMYDEFGTDSKKPDAQTTELVELGLPVRPPDYGIPQYDIPVDIFRHLCGCKFSKKGEFQGVKHGKSHRGKPTISRLKAECELPALVSTFIPSYLSDNHDKFSSTSSDSGVNSSDEGEGTARSPFLSNIPTFVGDFRHTRNGSIKKARLFNYNPVTSTWTVQRTLVWLGPTLSLAEGKRGKRRSAFDVQFLHQDGAMNRYVGKRYRKQRCPQQYYDDVISQKTARFIVTLFNASLKSLHLELQVQYVSLSHMQILSSTGELEDWVNVEPFLDGEFIKLTNNLTYTNPQYRALATALTHFSHVQTKGRLMLVEVQGLMPTNGKGVVYLTDPQFHSSGDCKFSSRDIGDTGMDVFWETVHPECNDICQSLGLPRPDMGSLI